MKSTLALSRIQHLLKQRNMVLVACSALLLTNFTQALIVLCKSDHIIVMPPEIKQAFWVERHRVAPAYLEEMALFLSGLILNVSPASSAYQRDVVLRYATPASYGTLRRQLIADETRLAKHNVSTSFRPVEVKVDGFSVQLTGDLMTYVGDKRVAQVRETYTLVLSFKHGQVQLQSFTCPGESSHE